MFVNPRPHARTCLLVSCTYSQTEIAKRAGLVVTGMGTTVYQLQDTRSADGKSYEVDLADPKCCDYVSTHLQPCRHMVPVFFARSMMNTPRKVRATILKYWPTWALAEEYLKIYETRTIRIPAIYPGPFIGPEEDRLQPPIQKRRKPGRPKKERIRYTRQTVRTVAECMPQVYNAEYASVLEYM